MLTVKDLLKNWKAATIEDEKDYIILWTTNYADELEFPLCFYGKWSEIKSLLEKLSIPRDINYKLWIIVTLYDIYYTILLSEVFEVDKKYKDFYKKLCSVSVNILKAIS